MKSSDPKFPIYSEAFHFLGECATSRFDFTSAEALNPKRSKILPPAAVLDAMREINFDDFDEVRGKSRGESETLEKCANFFNRFGIECSQENLSLTNNILSAVEKVYERIDLTQGEKILVMAPIFGYYFEQLKSKNIDFEIFHTKAEDGFLPNSADLAAALDASGAKAVLMCYPNNPTGAVMTQECAMAISEIFKERNIFVISDEAFINNSLSEKRHFPIAAAPQMRDRSFTVTSAAKSVFVGVKTGFCVGGSEFIGDFERVGGYPTKKDQRIMSAALEDSEEIRSYLATCREYYLTNIETVKQKLTELNQKFSTQFSEEQIYVRPLVENPDAANVYLLDFSGLRGKEFGGKAMDTGLDAAKWLLREASIGTVPGECFAFDEKEMIVRIALNPTQQELIMAFDSAIAATHKIQNSPETIIETSEQIVEKLSNNTVNTQERDSF